MKEEMESSSVRSISIPDTLLEAFYLRVIRPAHVVVWCLLFQESGNLSIEELCDRVGIGERAMSRIISELAEANLVVRLKSDTDRRRLFALVPVPLRHDDSVKWTEVPSEWMQETLKWNLKPIEFVLLIAIKRLQEEMNFPPTQREIAQFTGLADREALRRKLVKLVESEHVIRRGSGRGKAWAYLCPSPNDVNFTGTR